MVKKQDNCILKNNAKFSKKKNKLKTRLWKNGLSWANKIYHTEFINSTHAKSFDKETNRLADIAKKTHFLHSTVIVRHFWAKKLQ